MRDEEKIDWGKFKMSAIAWKEMAGKKIFWKKWVCVKFEEFKFVLERSDYAKKTKR